MREKRLTTEPPIITEEGFEDSLATDDLLVDYFNEFLSLPTFSEAIRFNVDYGVFEVVSDAPHHLEKELKRILHEQKPRNPIYDVVRKEKERCSTPFPEKPNGSTKDDTIRINYNIMATVTQTLDWFTMAKQSQHTVTTFSSPTCVLSTGIQSEQKLDGRAKTDSSVPDSSLEALNEGSMSVKDTASQALLRIYLERKQEPPKDLKVFFSSVDDFVFSYIRFIMKTAMSKFTQRPYREDEEMDINFNNVARIVILEEKEEVVAERKISDFSTEIKPKEFDENIELVSLYSKPESIGSETRADWCISHKTYDIGTRKEFERFKKFMKGTQGEKYQWLWMDIERLKVLRDPGRQQRHLEKMRKNYLMTGGDYYLTPEVLIKLNLIDGSFWNEPHLRCIQSEIVKPLLQYWGPRFCVTHSYELKNASAVLKFWHSRQDQPRKDIDPFPQMVTLLPLRPKSCIPLKDEFIQQQILKSPRKSSRKSTKGSITSKKLARKNEPLTESVEPEVTGKSSKCLTLSSKVIRLTSFTDISECLKPQLERRSSYTEEIPVKKAAPRDALFGSEMQNLLQSLYVENRAGFFFTKFCEQSGNELWKNSTYFWFDLQNYHQLFYQETLQPFKVCKQAQYLYAMYIAPSAPLDIGLEHKKKKEIYMKIDPPFEDLFDAAEEYILLLLLEPWVEMVKLDQNNYEQVEQVKQDRQLDSLYFRQLQAMHKETVLKKDEEDDSDLPDTFVPKQTQLWDKVPEEFRHLNFNYLINNKLEFEHFRQFLAAHSASIDLMCWIDIEQFRRILHQNKKQREAKSTDIKNKYLNKKYFFGPTSPATKEQQDEIMQLAGGWGMILHEQLASSVLLEIQKCVRRRLENMWLPLFLASEQFASRQKTKLQMADIAEDVMLRRQGEKIGVWKPEESKWISSSTEILAFRKALLNPLTAKLFQRYVSLKGDLLGNDVLFWQEVQNFKDLCHSHCEDAIIQNKITTIINCFINSSIPPALQIDLPFDQAQKIIEHRKELGPYVFREAQMTIFGVLFKYWPDFCEFQSNLTEEKALSALERRRDSKKRHSLGTEESKSRKHEMVLITRFSLYSTVIIGCPFTLKASSRAGSSTASVSGKPSGTLAQVPTYSGKSAWCYSKYIEALEQERTLLKIQEDLEKKINISSITGRLEIRLFYEIRSLNE
ncbi:regulator of G-protein signaling 22 [Gracilinanus agilis]|uniref:regulator of G-protein signaling 22 n=1 Tax=Gracilinanus agilis TaxID=191870 RepID=UPI001CFC623A|nr:regulator of G-protein signaling 22 [Gracilinanus agilis]